MDTNKFAEIKARSEAATKGPWRWFGNTDVHHLYLATTHSGRRYVMKFKRYGMRQAQPVFQDYIKYDGTKGECGIMRPAKELVRYEIDPEKPIDAYRYRRDITGINNPDAEFIAHSKEDIEFLIDYVEYLQKRIEKLERTASNNDFVDAVAFTFKEFSKTPQD